MNTVTMYFPEKKILTLCLIIQPPRILLDLKKKGFGAGWYNGFGGKVEDGEDIAVAAKREVVEEVGIEPLDMVRRGLLNFNSASWPTPLEVHIFSASRFSSKPQENQEMRPEWFTVEALPFDRMWPNDKYWWPYLLAGKNFRGHCLFGENHTLLKYHFEEINDPITI